MNSVDGRPNHRNKAAFSNFSDVVWTGPWTVDFLVTRSVLSLGFWQVELNEEETILIIRRLHKVRQ